MNLNNFKPFNLPAFPPQNASLQSKLLNGIVSILTLPVIFSDIQDDPSSL